MHWEFMFGWQNASLSGRNDRIPRGGELRGIGVGRSGGHKRVPATLILCYFPYLFFYHFEPIEDEEKNH